MGSNFPDFDAPEQPRPTVRRPIDYSSRNTKLRLFGAVALLILILALAERARDPASWNWFFSLEKTPQKTEERINNRLARKEGPAESNPEGTITVSKEEPQPAILPGKDESPKLVSEIDPVQQTWSKSWKAIWRDIGTDDRTFLYRLLESAQDAAPFGEPDAVSAENTIDSIDRLWTTYQTAAFQEIGSLAGNEQDLWIDTLRQVNGRWKEVKRALQLTAKGGTLTSAEQKLLADFQEDVNRVCFALVRDDATFLRPDEKQLWFHLLHDLKTRNSADLAGESLGNVGYAAMYNQPETYRGKLVTLRAQVRWAYRVQAIDNHLGIKEFNVLWLVPEGSGDTPIVVYALGLPPGFPELKDRDKDRGMTKLYEDVVVMGYFFKRGAYRGQDGTYTAPLVLANVPVWKPMLGSRETEERGAGLLGEAIVVAFSLFVIGVGVVYIVFLRQRTPRRTLDDEQVRANIADLKKLDLLPSTSEAPQKMAEEAKRDPK